MKKLIKSIFFVGLFLVFLPQAQAVKFYEGQTAYVSAPSGLNMRSMPTTQSGKTGKVPHNAQVSIIGYDEPPTSFYYEGISGHWVYINYNEQYGYVFDGYLSETATVPKPSTGGYNPGGSYNDYTVYCYNEGNVRRVVMDYQSAYSSVPCNVTYYKENGAAQTIANARNTQGLCEEKMNNFISKLRGWGWYCE